jgi:RecA-family ATPase
MSIKIDDAAPDGFLVKLFNGGDEIAAKDHVRSKCGMPAWQPSNGKLNGHANRRSADDEIEEALAGTLAEPAPRALSPPIRVAPTPRQLVANYDYRDIGGTLIYQVQRWRPKAFTQRRPNGNHDWVTQKVFEGISRIPYRWPELATETATYPDAPIFVTEGEKDCDNVRALGLFATCAAGSVWTVEIANALKGCNVIVLSDHDQPGREKAVKAGTALHGFAKSIRIASFSDLPEKGDVSDWIALDPEKRNAPVFDPKVETPEPVTEPLPFVDLSSWRVNEGVPPREWGVRDLFPRRSPALLSGEGATGKTLLLLQLGVAHVLGRDWLGTLPEPGPFLYFGAEDETDEIHRRLADILKHYEADFPDLQGNIHLLTFAGEDAVLGHADRSGLVQPTALFERLMKAAIEIKPVLIGIDTSADVFAGNENDRAQVRQFVGMLRKMAMQANAYIIINSHPSLTGINSGSGLSGSTGWHNSVRARAYLTTVKTDKDDEPDPNLRKLEFKKNNYGPVARSIDLRWKNGVYVPVGRVGSVEKMAKEHTADRFFVALLDRFNSQGRNVSEKAASKNYAPTMFSKEDEAKKYGLRKADLEGAMRRLFEASQIAVEPYGSPCRGTTRLVTT